MLISRNTFSTPDPALYAMLKRAGYEALDLNEACNKAAFAGTDEENAAFLRDVTFQVQNAGLAVGQCHAPMTDPLKGQDETAVQAKIRNIAAALRACDRVKIPCAVIHPFIWSWAENEPDRGQLMAFNRTYLRTVCAGITDTVVCLENMPGCHGFLRTADEMKEMLAFCDLPDLCVCYDTGHGFSVGQKGSDFFGTLKGKIRAMHIHDTLAGGDFHLPMHTGCGDWRDLSDAARKAGYEGNINSESKLCYAVPPAVREEGQRFEAALLSELRNEILAR